MSYTALKKKMIILGLLSLLLFVLNLTSSAAVEWPKTVSIASGSVGGTFFYVGGALAKIFDKMEIRGKAEVTAGSVTNPKLIHSKQVPFGIIALSSAWQAYTGTGWAEKKYDNIRSMAILFPSIGHGYTLAKSNIKTFRDFNGKIVSGGPSGSTSDLYLREFGALLGVKFGRVATVPFSDTINLLRDGMIDGGWGIAGIPFAAANEVTSTLDGIIVGFTIEDVKKIQAKSPFFQQVEIIANTYKNQPHPLPAPADWNSLFVHKDMPDDLVYKYLETMFANVDIMVATHKSLKDATMENQKYQCLPLHPGAYKFFKEKGVPIPDSALPP